jgi:hypothetical protein
MFNYLGTMPSQVDHEINHCTGKYYDPLHEQRKVQTH